jgi:hypothetical protein
MAGRIGLIGLKLAAEDQRAEKGGQCVLLRGSRFQDVVPEVFFDKAERTAER